MTEAIDLLEGDVIEANPPTEGEWIPVPAPFFAGGDTPTFALFDHNRHVADLRVARTVYVSPSDAGALSIYLRNRLPGLRGSSRAVAAARAWAIHRALVDGLTDVLRELPNQAGRTTQLRNVIDLTQMMVEWVPAAPAPYLEALSVAPQSTSTHGVTTALFALVLGAAQGVDIDALGDLAMGGLLADAGKASMPESIWQKAGPLSAEEWDLMRHHPERSVALLRRAGIRSVRTLRGIRWHHERWDGSGYPDRLKGAFIPIEARIIGIADAFAALTVDRPFTQARGGYEALMEMAHTQGQFDPALLRLFVTTIGTVLPASGNSSHSGAA